MNDLSILSIEHELLRNINTSDIISKLATLKARKKCPVADVMQVLDKYAISFFFFEFNLEYSSLFIYINDHLLGGPAPPRAQGPA